MTNLHPDIRTIEREELRQKLARHDDFKLVNALNARGFRAKRIPGSLHFDDPASLHAALGKNDDIVVYCSNVDCRASQVMYQDLVEHGYTNVRRYAGGLVDWEDAGLPIEGNMAPTT
jgi:rhodanese-related sulfurtransferase